MPPASAPSLPLPRQHGAALATALFFLVILTLLGLAAMRSGNVDLRLAQNEVDRIDAQQNAQTGIDRIWAYAKPIPVLPGSGYVQSCAIGSRLDESVLTAAPIAFSCPSDKRDANLLPAGTVRESYFYASIRREAVGSNDYAPVSAIRKGDSGDRFMLASFTVTGGYDHIATLDTSEAPQGGAEVAQGLYVKVARIKGVTQQ